MTSGFTKFEHVSQIERIQVHRQYFTSLVTLVYTTSDQSESFSLVACFSAQLALEKGVVVG
jgi:hypothetical protein